MEPTSDVRLLRRLAGPPHSGRARTARTLAPLADDLKPWLVATALLVATGERGRRAVFTGWQAVGVAALLAKTVGKAVRRARPARGALHHRGVAGDEPSSSSFPSTHTSSAVAFASAASAALPYAAPVLGPLAVLVSWTRPAGGRHYPSDILAGATIGAAAAVAVTVAHHRWHRAPTPTPGTLRTADSGYMSPRISR